MRLFVPDYYDDFHCIAERCQHNCCIGWEIDIDPDTLALYENIGGDFGERLKSSVSRDGEPHFVLSRQERCPFLNERGLCDIITELGDGALCDICADHPRYRNYVGEDLEMGLGLSCEEAARLILSHKNPTRLIDADTVTDAPLAGERKAALAKLQNREIPFSERLSALFTPPECDCFWLFSSLERLDPEWDNYLELLKETATADLSEFDNEFEQLAVYFFLRHGTENPEEGLRFSLFSVYIIRKIAAALKAKKGTLTFDELCDLCRAYSSEIEYSDINSDALKKHIARDFLMNNV